MKKIFLILLTELIFVLSFSQQARIDSLLNELNGSKEDTNKVYTLYWLSDGLQRVTPQKAIEYAEEGISLARKIGFKRGVSICINALGNAHSNIGNYDKALNLYKERLTIV